MCLIRRDASSLNQLGIRLDLGADEGFELDRLERHRVGAELFEVGLHRGISERLGDLAIEPIDDLLRGAAERIRQSRRCNRNWDSPLPAWSGSWATSHHASGSRPRARRVPFPRSAAPPKEA